MNARRRDRAFAIVAAGLLGLCLAFGWGREWAQNPAWKIAGYLALWPLGLGVVVLWPEVKSTRAAWALLFGLALGARLALLAHPPGDDINRYLWEGHLVRLGESPYTRTADAAEWAPLRDDYWRGMNHRDLHTIYPPVAQWYFAAVGAVSYRPVALKLSFIAFDLGALVLVALLLARRHLPLRFAGLYAFNPVTLMAIAGEGHFDALLVFLIVAALLLVESRRPAWAWVALGLAVQIKLVAVLLAPLLLRRGGWRYAGWGLLVALVPWLAYFGDLPVWFGGVKTFGGTMAFNGFVHALLVAAGGGLPPAAWWCGGVLAAWTALVVWKQSDPVRAAFGILGGLVVLSPTVHYWYLTWPLVLLPFCPSPAWLVLSGSMGFYFLAWGNMVAGPGWALPRWGQLAIWTPFALLGLREAASSLRQLVRARKNAHPPAVHSLAIVVPALDEAKSLPRCLASIRALRPAPAEVIVADGGSTDGTLELAQQAGVTVVAGPRGRGRQIATGVARATTDAVLVLHADSVVVPDCGARILAALNAHPDAGGGAVGQRFDADTLPLLVVEILNDLRALFFGSSFGDQGQFFRREPVVAGGGFPTLPLMEDVEFSRRLRALGPTLYLGGGLVCSARRWQQDGWRRRFALVLALTAKFHFCRRNSGACAEELYRQYYPGKALPPGLPGKPPS